jgi:hypothetical protein
MWSHYAQSHTGMCLGFVVHADMHEIEYRKHRFTESELGGFIDGSPNEAQMARLLFSKHNAWKYEREWRLWASFHPPTVDGKFEFINFSDDLILRQIIVGYEASNTRKEIETAIGNLSTIEKGGIFKMRPAFKTFRVVKNRNPKLWK